MNTHLEIAAHEALGASSIGRFEQSVRALADYYRTVDLLSGASVVPCE